MSIDQQTFDPKLHSRIRNGRRVGALRSQVIGQCNGNQLRSGRQLVE